MFFRIPYAGGRLWIAALFCSGLYLGTAAAEEGDDRKASRLGFHFDQKAHDAAVAAEVAKAEAEANDATVLAGDVLRLPRYVVRDDRVRLEDSRILTPKGKLEVAEKRYLNPAYKKTLGPLSAIAGLLANPLGGWNPNAPEAMALYEQDEKLRREAEMDDLLDLEELSDHPDNKKAPPSRKPKR